MQLCWGIVSKTLRSFFRTKTSNGSRSWMCKQTNSLFSLWTTSSLQPHECKSFCFLRETYWRWQKENDFFLNFEFSSSQMHLQTCASFPVSCPANCGETNLTKEKVCYIFFFCWKDKKTRFVPNAISSSKMECIGKHPSCYTRFLTQHSNGIARGQLWSYNIFRAFQHF